MSNSEPPYLTGYNDFLLGHRYANPFIEETAKDLYAMGFGDARREKEIEDESE